MSSPVSQASPRVESLRGAATRSSGRRRVDELREQAVAALGGVCGDGPPSADRSSLSSHQDSFNSEEGFGSPVKQRCELNRGHRRVCAAFGTAARAARRVRLHGLPPVRPAGWPSAGACSVLTLLPRHSPPALRTYIIPTQPTRLPQAAASRMFSSWRSFSCRGRKP